MARPRKDGDDTSPPGAAGRSLRRATSIIRLIHESGEPRSVADMVSLLSIPKSTAYDLVRVMVDEGLITPREDGRFALGRSLHEFGRGYSANVDLLREGTAIMRALRDETGETVQLSVMDGSLMHVLHKEEGTRAVRIISQIGSRLPVNWAASGRLLVSDLDDAALTGLLRTTVAPSPTRRAETDVTRLIAQIRACRAQGYSVEIGETNDHAGCIAAPILSADGICIAALSVIAPEHRLHTSDFERLVEAVVRRALEMSRTLGRGRFVGTTGTG